MSTPALPRDTRLRKEIKEGNRNEELKTKSLDSKNMKMLIMCFTGIQREFPFKCKHSFVQITHSDGVSSNALPPHKCIIGILLVDVFQ